MSEARFSGAIDAARDFIAERARGDWHTVASVVLTRAGHQYLSVNIDSALPRAGVCAEPVAIGMAIAHNPDDSIAFCAAVSQEGKVIPPCGVCRELLLDYGPYALIALPEGDGFRVCDLRTLIPDPYKPGERKGT